MRVIPTFYRCLAFCTNRNLRKVESCAFSTNNNKNKTRNSHSRSTMTKLLGSPQTEDSTIEDVFARLRENPKEIFLLDGGTGEELFRRKVPDDRTIWSATALVHSEYHGILQDVHTSFLQSGSNAITTNSYGVVPGVGFEEDEISFYMEQSGKIARRSIQEYKGRSGGSTAFCLGSLGPLVESYRADMILPHDEGVEGYRLACTSLAPYADAFLAETMSCVNESIQVLDALAAAARSPEDARDKRPSLLISYSIDSEGRFRDGENLPDGMRRILEESKKKTAKVQLLAILFNCAEPEVISQALKKISKDSDLVNEMKSNNVLLGAYAHTLTPVDPNWTLAGSETPQPLRNDVNEETYWKDFVEVWINQYGVRIVGGCCGITPEHIQYIKEKVDGR